MNPVFISRENRSPERDNRGQPFARGAHVAAHRLFGLGGFAVEHGVCYFGIFVEDIGRDTKPEVRLRKLLFASGFRFRLHRKDLPGKPDIVLPKWNAAIFVPGCFWRRHEGCSLAASPATRTELWQRKFAGNVERDARNRDQLLAAGWRVAIVWECGLRKTPDVIAAGVISWLMTSKDQQAAFPDLNAPDAPATPLPSGGGKRGRAIRRRVPAAGLKTKRTTSD